MEKYDLCIIGSGPAGYASAMRAVDMGKRVALVEKDKIGGAGLHNGALSSKTFWEIAHEISHAREQAEKYGVEHPDVPFAEVVREVDAAVAARADQLANHLSLVNAGNSDGQIDFIHGRATLEGPHTVRIHPVNEGDTAFDLHAENVILATGSRPRKLPVHPIDEQIVITSDGIGNLKDYPKSMVILGAGVIGCEFATIFALLGKTKVYLIDKGDRILPFEDEDVVHVVERNLEAAGVHIHRKSRMIRMEIVDGQVEYELEFTDGHNEVFHVEKALISIGRVPNTEGLGLEKAGVQLTDRGHIYETAKDTSTTAPNVFAVGDITADIALVNVAELEGRFAIEKLYAGRGQDVCYDLISTIMFLHPEVAGVGPNEQTLQKECTPYRVACVDYSCIPRAIAMRNTDGFFKIIVSDDDEMKLLGMRAVGRHASSAIQAVALLIYMGKGIEELAACVHPHPSIVEGIQECVRMLLGKSILKPAAFRIADG
ncbi:MAG: NAD(P)/FAD-dependent oxidoreductase, partial [Bacteroidota bacterium]